MEKLDKISVLFDMTDCGLSNMDLDFVKYFIGLFVNYYPQFLSYIIVLDMAWVLNGKNDFYIFSVTRKFIISIKI